METRLKALSPKVGAVLFQLPPQFSKNRERLASFLGMLPRCYPYAFEFRHKSWHDDDILPFASKRMTSRSAFPIIMTHHRPGGDHAPRLCARSRAVTRTTTRTRPCALARSDAQGYNH